MLVVAQHGSTADKQYNWSYSVNYDEDTNIIQVSKQYLDNLGRSTQSMSKNLAANKVMATETVYDQYGRAVISTLPAPIGQDMVIRNNFITNNSGVPYSWQHFDDALLNNPAPVGKDSTNTLGIFYSNNGSEEYVATSSYPYSRIEYMADPTGRVKRGAAPGEQLKMGSGKESQMYYMFTAGELDRAYGVDSSFYCDISSQNPLHSTALTNTEIVAEKTISIDAEGTISISFISDGLTIASCVSGMSPTPSVPEQSAKNTLLFDGTRSADIHLPIAKSTTLKLPLPMYRIVSSTPYGSFYFDQFLDSSQITYKIMDLSTNQLLTENTHYTINSSTRFVTFNAPNKHRFLRISCSYPDSMLTIFSPSNVIPPSPVIEYKLDYSHFSVNYYDFSGKLRTNVSPKGFDYSVNGKHTEYSRYDYNPLGLVITKQLPDEGLTEFLYSDEGVLRFSQNAQQKQEDKFSYFRYDTENRLVEKGEYIENGGSTYEFAGYYDKANTGTDVKTIADSVSKLFTSQTHHEHYVAYDLLASADEIPAAYSYKSNFTQSNLKGKTSKTWNENHQTWYSYDYAGRLTFTVQELLDTNFNTDVDETIKTVNYTYAPVTSVILKEEYQKYHTTEKITNLYTYNANTQPITVVVKDAANQTIGQADFEYYLNGQLKRKVLGHHLQGLDYVYTLTGALKSMNHPTLELQYDPGDDGGENGFPEDLFAFAIDYHENDYVRTGSNVSAIVQDGYYNGLIKAVRWKMKDENEIYQSSGNIELYDNEEPDISLMYQYTYDKFYRLETANFGIFNGSDFTPTDHYQVYGGSNNDGIDYDIIGNITTLKRNGFDGDYDLLMDDLEYTYTSGTSQLEEIADNSGSSYSNDFNTDNGSTFLYNENGQMTAAYPDGVDHILYYPSGLIKQLINSNGDTISYTYNEQGKKIKTIFVDVQNNPNITTSTWYFTDAMGKVHGVYEKIDTAAVSLTTEVLYAGGRLATVSNNLVNYELIDHLGNVRVTFADTSSTSTPELMVTSWTDYYPFGEVLPGRSSNPEGHLFGYQGQQKAANNSKWYAFQLRMYNPSLGRWNSTDPYYQHASPYLAMANNPVSFVDPDGGRAEMTEYLKNKILRHIFFNKSKMTRIDYLRAWLGATGLNSYRGITLEGIYSILNGTAKGIHYQDRYYALDGYLGELGDGFLDGGRSPSQDLKLEGHNPINLGSRDLLAANGVQGDEFATLYTMANNFLGLNTAMSWVEAFGGEELLNLGIFRQQVGNEPNPATDPITQLFMYNEDGTKTILWSNPDYTPPGDEQVKNKHIPNGRNVVNNGDIVHTKIEEYNNEFYEHDNVHMVAANGVKYDNPIKLKGWGGSSDNPALIVSDPKFLRLPTNPLQNGSPHPDLLYIKWNPNKYEPNYWLYGVFRNYTKDGIEGIYRPWPTDDENNRIWVISN